jgi:hypothetical protein
VIRASSTRAKEGQRIFAPIATLWDDYLESETVRKLPPKLRKPLLALCQEISRTATRHFDAYIKGTKPSPAVTSQQPPLPPARKDATDEPVTQQPPQALTYAQRAASGPPSQPPPLKQRSKAPTTQVKSPPLARPDTRLFIRVGLDHISRRAGPFAVLTALKTLLGTDSSLLKEVQEVKSGFALCTGSLDMLAKLETHSQAISRAFTDSIVERQPNWTSYRLINIPRTVNTIDGLGQITSNLVTDEIIAEAIHNTTNQSLARAAETKDSSQKNLYNTSWIASFPTDSHSPLPRNLRILGAAVIVAVIKPKPRVVQCTRCYQWHNARNCIRPQHCRICGSTQHQEADHTTRCDTSSPHICPARCLHCGGPHKADDPSCPLRLTPRGPKTRSEKKAILEISKLARIRACTAANCSRKPLTDPRSLSTDPVTPSIVRTDPSQMEILPTSPHTPIRNTPQTIALTPTKARSLFNSTVNRFSPLSFNA